MVKVVNPAWCLERKQIIWIDCNPQAGQEMRDIHPLIGECEK